MNSIGTFLNDISFYNIEEYQKRSKLESHRNKVLKNLDKSLSLKPKSFFKNYMNDFRIVKNIKLNKVKIFELNNKIQNISGKKSIDDYSKENKKNIIKKSELPLLNKLNPIRKVLTRSNSLINYINMNNNNKSNYLFLEYKKEQDKNKILSETNFIEINPNKILSSLTEYSNIKKIFQTLTKKINNRNIKLQDVNNLNSKIDINGLLNKLYKNRKIKNSFNYFNRLNTSSRLFFRGNQNKNLIPDLFLLDIINKVINNAIVFHDKFGQQISEDFMFKEYKKQIKNLKYFFDVKINNKKNFNSINIKKVKIKFNNNINLKEKQSDDEKLNESINKSKNSNIDIFKKIKSNFKYKSRAIPKEYSKRTLEKNNESSFNKTKDYINDIFGSTKVNNLYNIDIGPKINIIDFQELLNKIYKQRVNIMNNNIKNSNENYLLKIFDLNKDNIKFENNLIEEKTKILRNENNKFVDKYSIYNSRNFYNRIFKNKKKDIRNKLFNENKIIQNKENCISTLRDGNILDSQSNESNSSKSGNDTNCIKIINLKEAKNNSGSRKINMEKLGLKNDFRITNIGFDKTINKIMKNHYNKMNKYKKHKSFNNISILNTIYGKINSHRKLKINEIDYKEEIKQKGFQIVNFACKHNQILVLNKNKSAENNIYKPHKEKINVKNCKTIDKGTITTDI